MIWNKTIRAGGALTLAFLATSANGHHAPTGWAYGASCCSGRDCAPITTKAVSAGPEGWQVHLSVGDHPLLTKPADFTVPYAKAKPSGDSEFHACINPKTQRLICLYAPQQGASREIIGRGEPA